MQKSNCFIVMFYIVFVKRKIIKREIFNVNIILDIAHKRFIRFLFLYSNININI